MYINGLFTDPNIGLRRKPKLESDTSRHARLYAPIRIADWLTPITHEATWESFKHLIPDHQKHASVLSSADKRKKVDAAFRQRIRKDILADAFTALAKMFTIRTHSGLAYVTGRDLAPNTPMGLRALQPGEKHPDALRREFTAHVSVPTAIAKRLEIEPKASVIPRSNGTRQTGATNKITVEPDASVYDNAVAPEVKKERDKKQLQTFMLIALILGLLFGSAMMMRRG